MPARLFFRIIATQIPVVLGYTFLHRHQPWVNWRRREVQITQRGTTYVIPALPATDVFRMVGRIIRPGVSSLEVPPLAKELATVNAAEVRARTTIPTTAATETTSAATLESRRREPSAPPPANSPGVAQATLPFTTCCLTSPPALTSLDVPREQLSPPTPSS